ncbi:MAG TPA: hypothetical protein VI911_09005 [Patescibacteria group bacterium]|nr:MAG: hypothetical protein UR43_C0005G0031 [candidate division TM6 bacterium GW2011_GWF2_33_332]HLD91136.1 hypothetical protein [Patescibacteria group bacterium]
MKININHYRTGKKILENYLKMFPNTEKSQLLAEFSATQGVPLLICYYFLGELQGFDDFIRNKIIEYKKYYDIDMMEGETYE